jgi:hypothetical protein
MVMADKYGVLPLFRPFVSHWLPHARPSSEDMDPHYVHRMEAAWKLCAVGLVQDHVWKLVYDTVILCQHPLGAGRLHCARAGCVGNLGPCYI